MNVEKLKKMAGAVRTGGKGSVHTVKGLEAVKKSKHVYLEHYTAILGVDKQRLEAFYGVAVTLADRECVESSERCAQTILADAKDNDTSFLVVGDPFAATTHTDLMLRAQALGVSVVTVHNSSIFTAVAATGLQLYQFGQTVSIPFFSATWRPDSFYEKIATNRAARFHTLCLLDIKVKEQTEQNLAKGIAVYEPPRYMTIATAIAQLLEVEDKYKKGLYTRDTLVVGVARLGQPTQRIIAGSMAELMSDAVDFGGPLHSLVLPGECHFVELEMLEHFHWNKTARAAAKAAAEAKQQASAAADHKAERAAREELRKKEDAERAAKAAAEKERIRKQTAAALAKGPLPTAAAATTGGSGSGSGSGAGGAAATATATAAAEPKWKSLVDDPNSEEVPSLF